MYAPPGRVEAIEIASPGEASFEGRPMIGQSFSEVANWLRAVDPDLEIDESGLTSLRLGLALCAPSHAKDDRATVESVLVFADGYYD